MENEEKNTVMEKNKMGTMPVGKLLANMAVPMMFSMLAQAFYNIVDSIYVAKISEGALTAVSLAFPMQSLMIGFGTGTAVGMNALISRALGAKDKEQADRVANTSIFLYICTAVVFSLIGIFLSGPFFRALTDVEEIVNYGIDYTTIALGVSFGVFAQFCFEKMLQSTGRTRLSMLTQLLGAVINIILDPILIFGLLGFPRMEVRGAAVATVTGQIISACLGVFLCLRCNKEITLSFRKIRFDRRIAADVYQIGLPSIVMQSVGSFMNFCINKILIGFTTTATAVFGAYFKLQSFIFMPIFGLNSAMVPIISFNYGARDAKRVWKTVRLTIVTAICIMSVGCLLFETIPGTLLGLFSASDEMLAIGKPALRIIGCHFPLAGFCIIVSSVCQAVGNPMHSLISALCRQLVVLLPAAYLLSLTGRLELVWFAFPIAEIVAVIMNAFFLRSARKKADSHMLNG